MTSVAESQPIASSITPCSVGVASSPTTTASSFKTGYDCKFVKTPPEVLPTECSVCLHIPREPHLVSCCGHHFCKSCIERARSENKPCPLCNQPDFTATLDKNVQRHLNALKVYCTNKRKECEWVGELKELDHHLNANPTSGEELTGCEFVELSCKHGCGGRFQRRYLMEHHNNCPCRPFSCEYCGHCSTYLDVIDNHLAACGSHPVQCPNDCGSPSFKRQHLSDHLHHDCPLQKINCEFQFAGCLAQIQRKDMAAHMKECLPQHLSQLSNTTKMLATALEGDIKLRFGKLEGQQQSLKQELDIVSIQERDDFTAAMSEVENMNDSLQCQQDDHQKTIEVTQRSLSRKVTDLKQGFAIAAVVVIIFGIIAIAFYQQNQTVGLQQHPPSLSKRTGSLQEAIDSSNTQETVTNLQQKVESLQRAIDSSNTQETVTNLQQKVESLQQAVGKLQQTIENVQQNPPPSDSQPAKGHAWQQLQDQQDKQAAALHKLNTTLYRPPLDPSLSLAFGLAPNEANTNETSSFVVLPMNVFGAPCFSEKTFHCDYIWNIYVTAKLESEVDGSFVHAAVEQISFNLSEEHFPMNTFSSGLQLSVHTVKYTPKTRGHARLHVKINNTHIQGSPFGVFVHHDPRKLKDPVKTIGGLDNPWGIAINSQGEIYVTEYDVGRIIVYSSSGRKVVSRQSDFPAGIAIDGEDNVYVASKNKLEKFNNKDKLIKWSEDGGRSVTVHHNRLYVCDSKKSQVLEYNLSLKRINSYDIDAGGQLNGPSDVAFDSNGNMYIADSSRLVILDQEKQYIKSVDFGEGYLPFFKTAGRPQGVHVSGDYVYVSDTTLNQIFVLSLSGEFVHSFGTKGKEPGQFESPKGIIVDRNGFLYVCDYFNHRVQVF